MKSFTQFREELNNLLETDIYFEELTNDALEFIVNEEEFDLEDKINALLTLYERGEIELSEEEVIELTEAGTAVAIRNNTLPSAPPSPGTSVAVRSPTSVGPARPTSPSYPIKDVPKVTSGLLGRVGGAISKAAGPIGAVVTAAELRKAGQKSGIIGKDENDPFNFRYKGNGPNILNKTNTSSSVSQSNSTKPVTTTPIQGVPVNRNDGEQLGVVVPYKAKSTPPNQRLIGPMGGASAASAQSAKPVAKPVSGGNKIPVTKTAPVNNKPVTSVQRKALPSTKSNSNSEFKSDLQNAVNKMRETSSAMVTATNTAKNKLSSIPGTNRMNKPISPNGQTSTNIHKAIANLGGEPTRSSISSHPVSKSTSTSGGAPLPKSLAPQGSAKRDSQLAAQGYKKF